MNEKPNVEYFCMNFFTYYIHFCIQEKIIKKTVFYGPLSPWHQQLVLGWCRQCVGQPGPIDRTPGTPGFGEKSILMFWRKNCLFT